MKVKTALFYSRTIQFQTKIVIVLAVLRRCVWRANGVHSHTTTYWRIGTVYWSGGELFATLRCWWCGAGFVALRDTHDRTFHSDIAVIKR